MLIMKMDKSLENEGERETQLADISNARGGAFPHKYECFLIMEKTQIVENFR